ncbi:hypothetical protein M409DRAFT_54657 [Zasmidium cellare ATCC 36951]|uniref:Uncharacterized protein n=1 Tax=Zasmidium cellare ATCC 36951 TaxID=1080233 RepID=A0A6A6CJT7_ZASCE|nr:uncharacterized protein M409DRAFT_54657 [Zasmidium cellare ATCC 36951]KAF2166883.1 hypothetical protein M409DRAFT_54657 [Zasmidium cellare ATCC 36951]
MDADAAMMLADLGNTHRDRVSAPLPNGVDSRTAERQEAIIRAENRARREGILQQATEDDGQQHRAVMAWYEQSTFGGDDTADDLQNRFDGQGHRRELRQRLAQENDRGREFQENRFGEERSHYTYQRGGPSMPRDRPPPSRAARQPLAVTNPNRQRAPSPRSFGTRKFGPTRQGATPDGGIPSITQGLASAAQAMSTLAGPPAASSSTTTAAPASGLAHATSSHLAIQPPARSASPAFSTASSTSTTEQAVASAQARMRAAFAARQMARSVTPTPTPHTHAAPTVANHADAESEANTSHATDDPTAASSPEDVDDDEPWPQWEAPPANRFHSRPSPAVARAQNAVKAHLATQHSGQSTGGATAASSQNAIPSSSSAPPHLGRRTATGNVVSNGTSTSASTGAPASARTTGPRPRATGPSTPYFVTNGLDSSMTFPRGRATGAASVETTTNGTGTTSAVPRSRATNGGPSSPAHIASMPPPPITSAPRSPIVDEVSKRAQAHPLLLDESVKLKAFVSAVMRTARDLEEVEKHYSEFPERRPALDYARQKTARTVVKFAADGDQNAAETWARGRFPDRHWLVDAAFSAWSGATPEDAAHPTVQQIIKTTRVMKQENEAEQDLVTPTAQPTTSAGAAPSSDSTHSSATADTNSTAVSTPTPPRTAMGMLGVTFYDVIGSFLGNREFQLPVPVTGNLSFTSRAGDYNPLGLADAMEKFASFISQPTATV